MLPQNPWAEQHDPKGLLGAQVLPPCCDPQERSGCFEKKLARRFSDCLMPESTGEANAAGSPRDKPSIRVVKILFMIVVRGVKLCTNE